MEIIYLSKDGLARLELELRTLKTTGRSNMAKQIEEARDKGDLSENAEYDAAKHSQGLMEAKIANLENTIANARVVDESTMNTSKVMILSTVHLKNHTTKKDVKYTIVSESEANFKEGKISAKSLIGSALMGKKLGEVVDVTVPAGVIKLEILEISIS
ncbi:MAG: transcription elongation factor GreA [Bacteroidetes bacterium]|nr:transcription elongation factor GreA [Bacteroidota bacterium]